MDYMKTLKKREIIYIHDTMCGWCFVARPAIKDLRQKTKSISFRVLHQRLFSGPGVMTINDSLFNMVRRVGQTIGPKKTGARISDAHINFLHKDGLIYASDTTALAYAAVSRLNPDSLPAYADALQEEIFVKGEDFHSRNVMVHAAESLGIDVTGMHALMDDPDTVQLADKTSKQASELMSAVNGNGVPILLYVHDGQVVQLDPYDADSSLGMINDKINASKAK